MRRNRLGDDPRPWLLLAALVCASSASHAATSCTFGRLADLPVTMDGTVPLIHASVNGTDTLFIADSGAFYNVLTSAAASEFNLTLASAPLGREILGLGGSSRYHVAVVKTFTIVGVPVSNLNFVVVPNDLGPGIAGVLGQSVLGVGDVEYDLANGIIRLMRVKDCEHAMLAYWARGTDKPVSEMWIALGTASTPYPRGAAYVNGIKMDVIFDTGAPTSYLTLAAAKRAGVTPESAGVVDGGMGGGFGPNLRRSWIAPFASFRIGDEEVRNTHLRIGEGRFGGDMLVGADFFLSHRIWVANSQHKMYFTYNGGPVFDLAATPPTRNAAGDAAAPAPPAAADAEANSDGLDAAALARRGAASAGRRDYAHALADLTRAIAMTPAEPSYYYERGQAYRGNGQVELALADFDQAIKLKPDDVTVLLARAELRAARHDPAQSLTADLEAADRATSRGSAARVELGDLFLYAHNLPAAIAQYSAWIDTHEREDVAMPHVLNSRCWARALSGQQLDSALSDCDNALRLRPKAAAALDSRGLVYLRRGAFDKAIADYDASLRLDPKSAWSLYGRGLAKLRNGQSAAGRTDLAAAAALEPKIASEAARFGLSP